MTLLHLPQGERVQVADHQLLGPVAGFLGYPQPGGGAHPPIPREGVLGEELGDWASWL